VLQQLALPGNVCDLLGRGPRFWTVFVAKRRGSSRKPPTGTPNHARTADDVLTPAR
jgi:hypothetical protein